MANLKDIVAEGTDRAQLETLVDRYSLANVLEALVAVCGDKADHVRANWQDAGLAKDWATDARTIDRIIAKIRNAG